MSRFDTSRITDALLAGMSATPEGRAHLQESLKRLREVKREAGLQIERIEKAIKVARRSMNA